MTSNKRYLVTSREEQDRILEIKYTECMEEIPEYNTTFNQKIACEAIWDGLLCWKPSEAGIANQQPCPSYVKGSSIFGNATKTCTEEGWFVSPKTNGTWTNFSQCFSGNSTTIVESYPSHDHLLEIARYIPALKLIAQIGYTASLLSLILAFTILASSKRLRCPRNMLHMHMFVSFTLRAFFCLLKDSLFFKGVGLTADLQAGLNGEYYVTETDNNMFACKLIISLWQYSILANYSWILMEGLYLHNLIFLALFSDTSSVAIYVVVGWSLPIPFVLSWTLVRVFLDNTLCWTTHDNGPHYFLILKIPIIIFMLINFLLFINIIRVLLLKLTDSISEENRRYRYKRWAKSTLVLVPLFGVHFTLFHWLSYIGVNGICEVIWLFCDQLFTSFQGLFVAVLYCFLNGEVRSELQKRWSRRWSIENSGRPEATGAGGRQRGRRAWWRRGRAPGPPKDSKRGSSFDNSLMTCSSSLHSDSNHRNLLPSDTTVSNTLMCTL